MRIIVTGATGFVGRPLCAVLTAQGHDVVAVSRNPSRARELVKVSDAIAWEDLDAAMRVPTHAVVHLAGETVQGRWNARKIAEVRDSRIERTAALVEAISNAERTPAVLVSASGIGYYGSGGELLLQEDASPGEDYFAQLCVDWEELATSAPCRVAVMRFGMILGPGGGALKMMLLPARAGISGPLGGGKQWWSWISLDDAVRSLWHAIERPEVAGPVNVVSPEPIRQVDFNRVLCRVVNRPSFVPAPAFALRLILGTFATEVLGSKRVIPVVLSSTGFTWSHSDLEEAIREGLD